MDANTQLKLLLIHAGATLLMAGVIWVIQLVHYPLFALVGERGYERYQAEHMKRITWVVGPLMITEALCAVALLVYGEAELRGWASAGAGLLLMIWLSTALLQVPAHARLTRAWDQRAQQRLVLSNWLRTLGWSARGLIALKLLASCAP